jgi:hypothetical protein
MTDGGVARSRPSRAAQANRPSHWPSMPEARASMVVVAALRHQVAYQMIRSPLVGAKPKRTPRPQNSTPSRGSGTDPAPVIDRTAV